MVTKVNGHYRCTQCGAELDDLVRRDVVTVMYVQTLPSKPVIRTVLVAGREVHRCEWNFTLP
jgi:hypothetical protein